MFVKEYLIDLNARQAAIRAGYSEKTATEMGYENLSKPHIAKAIQEAMDDRSDRTELTADYILDGIKEVIERCLQHEEVTDHKGIGTGEYVFKENGALKGYELLGKHLKLFTDKIDHSFDPNAPLTLNITKTVRSASD